jgi:hypothetical protein
MGSSVRFPNLQSRLLMKQEYDDHFFLPRDVSRPVRWALEWFQRHMDLRIDDSVPVLSPVFITGLPRSGTTILYLLVCAHPGTGYVTNIMNALPDTMAAAESLRRFFRLDFAGERFLADGIPVSAGGPSEPTSLWGRWFGRTLDDVDWSASADLHGEGLLRIYHDIRSILSCTGSPDRRLVLKFPILQTEIPMLREVFPGARFLHLVRNPLQVVPSMLKLKQKINQRYHRLYPGDRPDIIPYPRLSGLAGLIRRYGVDSPECVSRIWNDEIRFMNELRLNNEDILEIRYEDFASHPEPVSSRILDFIGLDHPEPGDKVWTNAVRAVHPPQDKYLPGDIGKVVKSVCGRLMEEHGY